MSRSFAQMKNPTIQLSATPGILNEDFDNAAWAKICRNDMGMDMQRRQELAI
jgi:hypothetical protein